MFRFGFYSRSGIMTSQQRTQACAVTAYSNPNIWFSELVMSHVELDTVHSVASYFLASGW